MDKIIFSCLIFVATCSCLKLPNTFKKCDRKQNDFEQCLTKAVEEAIGRLTAPVKDLGIPNLDPLEIPAMVIGAGSGPVSFQQKFKNMKVSGFTKLKCAKVGMDFATKSLKMECNIPQLKLEFFYEVNGKILLLPIYGKGPGLFVLDDLDIELMFKLEEYEKKGVKHFKVVGQKYVLAPHLITYRFDNLFDGDKALGDSINQVMNDNWSEVFADVKPSYEDAFGKIFAAIFDKVLGKVSVVELFGDE